MTRSAASSGARPPRPPLIPDAVPEALKQRHTWVCWRSELRDGKPTKVPYNPSTGRKAKSNDPETWVSFEKAVSLFHKCKGLYSGIGIMFDDDLCGADLDHCVDPQTGEVEKWAQEIVAQLNSYTERTPSGTGLHILVGATLPPGRRRKGPIEMYGKESARYFTVTGVHLEGTPATVERREAEFADVHRRLVADADNGKDSHAKERDHGEARLDDDDLLAKARAAKNGAKFSRLWKGGYPEDDSAGDLALCRHLAFWAVGDRDRIDRLFRQSGRMRAKWERMDYRDATIAKALEGKTEFYEPGKNGLPKIMVGSDLSETVDKAQAALLADPSVEVFERGRLLVRRVRDGRKMIPGIIRPAGAQVIEPIPDLALWEMLSKVATWTREDAKGETHRILPPRYVPQTLAARGTWDFPYLAGIVEAPTMRPDGSILDRAGYDEATGLLYLPATEFPAVPERPTRDDARQAATTLLDPCQDFPFTGQCDRAALVAAVLTTLVRHSIHGCAPMFAVRSPAPGTGKGLLVDVISRIATGRGASVMSPGDDDETRKRILSAALEGMSTVMLDNVDHALGSQSLAAALTATSWTDRILGLSKMVTVPLSMTWFATGRGLTFQGDLGRRVVPIDMDARCESPEDRAGFRYPDLLLHVQRERPRLVGAALTLLRAFHIAGRPRHGGARVGSFEGWDDLVRGACIWVGVGDPAEGRKRIRAEGDEDLDRLRAALGTLGKEFAGEFTIAQAVERGEMRTVDGTYPCLDLRDALLGLAPSSGGRIDARKLGNAFRRLAGRIADGKTLARGREAHGGVIFWRIQAEHSDGGTGGTGGSTSPQEYIEAEDRSCGRTQRARGGKVTHQTNQTHQRPKRVSKEDLAQL